MDDVGLCRYLKNSYVYDNHLRPQHVFILPGSEVLYFEEGFKILFDILRGFCPELQARHLGHNMARGKANLLSSSAVPMTDELVDKICGFYEQDYRIFYPGDLSNLAR